MGDLSRREFISAVASAAAVVSLNTSIKGADPAPTTAETIEPADLHWLESTPVSTAGVTCTVPWPKGALRPETSLKVATEKNESVIAQSWPLGYWPDGSLKWTAHALAPLTTPVAGFRVMPGAATQPDRSLVVTQSADAIDIDTGVIRCRIPRSGGSIIDTIMRGGRTTLSGGKLICLLQDQPEPEEAGNYSREIFSSLTASASVENSGAVRAVVKIEGSHLNSAGRPLLLFIVRLYFYTGSDQIRIVHTFIFDGDAQKDFIRGIGVRFDVPMTDEPHNRYVRFSGDGPGIFAEAVRTVTGLRRDPGSAIRKAQIDGVATPPIDSWDSRVSSHMDLVPQWGDFTLSQLSADGFQIRKRTKAGYSWIAAGAGRRSGGTAYIGGASGGVSLGIRDFWQKHPAQLDIRNAHTDLAQVTMWIWSPDAPAMDMRFYHDGMGQDTFPKQREGLDITYEDYEPGYGSPYGIARTSELLLQVVQATPSREAMVTFADAVRLPPTLVCESKRYLDAGVFGGIWTLPDSSTPAKALIEQQLSFYLNRYINEVEQRSWYGFWDFGDVRHTYDDDRHVWRYDVGGFAWDNSELSTDLWLWYSFLRTGRADVYRMAEAMTRHTGEVDVYHIGPHKGLGTRHGVQHWGDSSKQTRISSALFRRPFFFLTADERVGDLLRAQLTEDQTWLDNDVTRKLGLPPGPKPTPQAAPWTPLSWGQLAAAWLTEIERTRDATLQTKLLNGMRSIAEIKTGFFSAHTTMDLATGIVTPHGDQIAIEHLNAMFGLAETCAELVKTYGSQAPAFADAWSQYGDLYSATSDEREKQLGVNSKSDGFFDSHSRCLAFTAWHRKDPALAKRAWKDWLNGQSVAQRKETLRTIHLEGPTVLSPIVESPRMSTNSVAQFGLSTMQNLAFIGEVVEVTA